MPPRWCPACKNQHWTEARRPQSTHPKTKRGRTYPLDTVDIGGKLVIPWPRNEKGAVCPRRSGNIGRAIRQEEERYGKKFAKDYKASGIHLERIR